MPATYTYNDGVAQPHVLDISDEMLGVLEKFRLTFGNTYPTIPDMIEDLIKQGPIRTALNSFPTKDMVTAQKAVDDAMTAKQSLLDDTVKGVKKVKP
jgi:hypothetical protein